MFARLYIYIVAAIAVGCGLWWLFSGHEDPRELALGEWQESTSRLKVEITPEKAAWRGMGHGTTKYTWLNADTPPYRVSFTYQGKTVEALVTFDGSNTAIFEPQVWEHLPALAQQHLRDLNRRHNRPEKEFRVIFRRVIDKKS